MAGRLSILLGTGSARVGDYRPAVRGVGTFRITLSDSEEAILSSGLFSRAVPLPELRQSAESLLVAVREARADGHGRDVPVPNTEHHEPPFAVRFDRDGATWISGGPLRAPVASETLFALISELSAAVRSLRTRVGLMGRDAAREEEAREFLRRAGRDPETGALQVP